MAAVALVLCVYLLSVASRGVVGDKVYTVVANQSASSCLSENKTECSLMYYAAHPDQYFREDNTTFHFLPGQHELVNSTLVLMANISNLLLYGTDVHEVTVVCSGGDSGGFSFYNINKRGQNYHKSYPSIIFNNTFSITHGKNDLSVVSSDPMYVGFCNVTQLEQHNCTLNKTVLVKPGKTFAVSAVIMGQHHGLVAGVVVAKCIDEDCSISNNEYSQYITSSIISGRYLTYTVFSRENRNVSLKLVAEDYFSGFPSYQYQPSFINTIIEKCPLGFIERDKMCSCLKGIPCNITNQTIFRSSPHWIGYRKECGIKNSKNIISHSFCP
jgi:hypothetical protein